MGRSELGAAHSGRNTNMEAKVATKVNGGRIRKVTITEVGEDATVDPKPIDDEKSTEEILNEVDKMITDWKTNLEVVVGEGLKKIKKICREKKTMIKYLPGDGTKEGTTMIQEAKSSIMIECFTEVLDTVANTHSNLFEVGKKKNIEAEQKIKPFKREEKDLDMKPKTDRANYYEMKQMMKDLESVYSQYNDMSFAFNKVPIYSINSDSNTNHETMKGIYNFSTFWNPMCSLNRFLENPKQTQQPLQIFDTSVSQVMKDFVNIQKPIDTIMKEWKLKNKKSIEYKRKESLKKEVRKGKMGKGNLKHKSVPKKITKKFVMREFLDKGEKHYILVKKSIPEQNSEKESEEIFADCKSMFFNMESARNIRPRKRKISHRQERKEMLKEAEKEVAKVYGPQTYSEILKKHLKIKPEQEDMADVMENWNHLLDENNECTHVHKKTKDMEDIDFFKVWKHNFHNEQSRTDEMDIINTTTCIPSLASFECGQPSILTVEKKRKTDKKVVVKPKNTVDSVLKKTHDKENKCSTYPALKSNTEVVPYVEKSIDVLKECNQTEKNAVKTCGNEINRLDRSKEESNNDFQPSNHSKRQIVLDADTVKQSTKEQSKSKKYGGKSFPSTKKNILPSGISSDTWTSLILPMKENSSKEDNIQKEEVFNDCKHIFEEMPKPDDKPNKKSVKQKAVEKKGKTDKKVVVKPKNTVGSKLKKTPEKENKSSTYPALK